MIAPRATVHCLVVSFEAFRGIEECLTTGLWTGPDALTFVKSPFMGLPVSAFFETTPAVDTEIDRMRTGYLLWIGTEVERIISNCIVGNATCQYSRIAREGRDLVDFDEVRWRRLW